ncbi:hypothetical protein G6011_05817 [Alternaria panax]|uniref:Piwi domain-containing protein n=1 Tax=Alternaria panax TaxID=48097 RepID=A0AAD4FEB8_9PLEO|nr:hypothetical protein G6011_05817 [Alternaria panax]
MRFHSRAPPTAKAVNSQRLRKAAIEEYVKKLFPDHWNRYAVEFWVEANGAGPERFPVDHLLLLKLPNETRDQFSVEIEEKRGRRVPLSIEKVVINVDGTRETKKVHCIHKLSKVLHLDTPDPETASDYWRKLNIVLQAFIRDARLEKAHTTKNKGVLLPISPLGFSPSSTVIAPIVVTKSLPAGTNTASIHSAGHIQDATKVEIFLRTLAKLDPNQRKLHLELDLVPGVNENTSLADIVTSVFGRAIQGQDIHHHLPSIRAILTGLEVRRAYTPSTIGLDDRSSEVQPENLVSGLIPQSSLRARNKAISRKPKQILGVLSSSQLNTKTAYGLMDPSSSQASSQNGPQLYENIQDIQLARDVPDFIWKDGKRYSVAKYFKEKTNVKVQRFDLPLARVGNNSWVPFEVLVTSSAQSLPTSILSNKILKNLIMEHDLQAEQEIFPQFASTFPSKIETSNSSEGTASRKSFIGLVAEESAFVSLLPKSPTTLLSTGRKLLSQATGPDLKMGVIYVRSKSIKLEDATNFVAQVAKAICKPSQKYRNDRDTMLNILRFNEKSLVLRAVISDTKPLLLPDCQDNKDVEAIRDQELTTIFAIIDEQGRSKCELCAIRAELHKFGNRKAGVVVHCMTASSLKMLLTRNKAIENYFPIGTLQYLNDLHGGRNFKINEPESLSASNLPQGCKLMIIGAHVSHPPPNAAKNCPSVSAMVGSVDNEFTQYRGSARVQSTIRPVQDKKGNLKQHHDPQIQDLQAVMEERITAWQAKHTDTTPHIIFYRDGMNIVKDQFIDSEVESIVRAETEAVSRAFTTMMPGAKPSLSYILVNKRSVAGDMYGRDMKTYLNEEGIVRFSLMTDPASKNRFDYHVMPPAKGTSQLKLDFEAVTRHLNANYQLSDQAVPAVVLPVYCARKLALRVFDYFHFAVSNEYDAVPSVIRRSKYPSKLDNLNDDCMTALIRDYLSIENAQVETATNSPQGKENMSLAPDDEPARVNPWSKSLDDTMFFL